MRHPGVVYGHSKGRAPGSKHYYKQVYSGGKWDEFLTYQPIGTLLQVCAGGSFFGAVRVDRDEYSPSANVRADAFRLPFGDKSFDTVACDPPYEFNYPKRINLQRELTRVARKRILFKAPWVPRATGWRLVEPVIAILSHTCANVAVMVRLDKVPEEEALFQ